MEPSFIYAYTSSDEVRGVAKRLFKSRHNMLNKRNLGIKASSKPKEDPV